MMQRLDPAAPASSRHEYVVALAIIGALSGIGSLAAPRLRPESVLKLLPWPLTVAWLLCLTLGAVVLLVAIISPDRWTGLLLERPAMLFLGAGALVYGICLAATWKGTGFFAATNYLFWGGASLIRALRIRRYVRTKRTNG